MDYTVMDQYWIWLSSAPGITAKKFYQLISEYEDPREVWQRVGMGALSEFAHLGAQAAKGLTEARSERYLFALFANLDKLGIRAITRLSDDYPSLLTEIFDPPPVLYVKGTADLNACAGFSMVGTRRPTHDGRRAATEIAEGLSKQGVTVVSGLARGIDTCAHMGALKANGKTIAVLGSGVDVIYPPENADVARQIVDTGGALISEFLPGTLPLPQHFPQRNRVIAGLTRGTLVVEGAKGSGAMITANMALDSGRDVFVVPGSIYSSLSYEPNRLLLLGAYPVLSEWEILEHYGWAQRPASGAQAPKIELSEEESGIVEPIRAEALSFGEIQANTGLSSAKLNSLLTMLELRGIIDKVPGSLYRAR